MNNEQWLSLLRSVLQWIGVSLAAKGVISSADATVLATSAIGLISAVLTFGPALWGIWARSHDAMIKSVNAADNGVTVVKTTDAVRASIPTINVAAK